VVSGLDGVPMGREMIFMADEQANPILPAAASLPDEAVAGKKLSPAAERALAEAAARRAERERAAQDRPKEIGGRGGLDPARYGDWEIKGIAADF
jgi:hypothetical protein